MERLRSAFIDLKSKKCSLIFIDNNLLQIYLIFLYNILCTLTILSFCAIKCCFEGDDIRQTPSKHSSSFRIGGEYFKAYLSSLV